MTEDALISPLTPQEAVERSQTILAHAWMVRTFVKHSEVVEDFPELMQVVRTVFDVSRALECHVGDPSAYLAMLRKKIGKLRQAADQFRHDAPLASDHTNFRQAVISMEGCVAELEALVKMFPAPAPKPMPATFRPPLAKSAADESDDPTPERP